ncbi:MAG: flagellar export protein FliJ [Ferrovum sp.]|nr:flagellar export protein FliJ [Ferrovum sp.]NDU88077.1 flagellar export protein FliJ [Ferrovum sp.]
MTRPFPLEILKTLSQQRNNHAARHLGQMNQNCLAEQKKLDLLTQFRADYQARYQAATLEGRELDTLANFRNFLARLDEAVRQQRTVVELAERQVQNSQITVTETHRQVQSMEALEQRHLTQEHLEESRAEQKMVDEQNGQRVARKQMEVE